MGIDLKQTQLRQQRTVLSSLAIGGALSGLIVWSVAPFVTQNKPLRFLALSYSMVAGLIACYSSSVLIRNQRIYKALDSSEIDDYLHQLAVTQYSQQRFWEGRAFESSELLEPNQTKDSGKVSSHLTNSELTELDANELIELVEDAKADGLSDSKIIKEILGYRGERYGEGKELLKQIKKQMELEENGEQVNNE